jgi:hypothetical protein
MTKGTGLMKTLVVFLALGVIACTSVAQVPVKKDLMQILEKVPPPPASVRDAYAKLSCGEGSGAVDCSAAKLFESVDGALKDVEDAYKAQATSGNAPLPPGVSPEMARKAQDPEMRKRMKGMSKEEKMKMAMEMMNSGSAGVPVQEVDPPLVRDALAEWMKVTEGIQTEFQRSVEEQQEEVRINTEYAKAHDEIGEWEKLEIEKLPRISSGEMSAPDPAKVKAVQLKAADRHIACADKRLGQIRASWPVSVKRLKTRFGMFHQKLVAADYASASKNFSTLKVLSDGQIIMLKDIASVAQHSRSAYEESGRWLAVRKQIEKQ